MQTVSLCLFFGLCESDGTLEVPDFQNIRKSTQTSFDISVYNSPVDTARFHTLVRDLSKLFACAKPTSFHHFLNELACSGSLLRHYTQNIDCTEQGLRDLWGKTVQLHGRIDKAMYQRCGWNGPLLPDCFGGSQPPDCTRCQRIALEREDTGKRRRGVGRLRPNVVLYGEKHPKGDRIGELVEQDLGIGPKVALVVGTALKVPGVRRLVRELCRAAKAQGGLTVWINKDAPPSSLKLPLDFAFLGDCDEFASLLTEVRGGGGGRTRRA